MIYIGALSVMALATTQSMHASPYQLPGLTICSNGACSVELDDNGYLVDTVSKNRLFARPAEQTMFNTYSLFRSEDKFVMELENTSSSKNWAALIFSYDHGKVHAVRYISLSRNMTSSNDGGNPDTIQWGGRDCRGDALLDGEESPFKSATLALCANHDEADTADLPKTEAVHEAASKGLVVAIPSYDSFSSINLTVTYFFPQADEPDAGALLCLTNCGVNDSAPRLSGWIGKSSWVDIDLHKEGDNYTGTYCYVTKKVPIPLKGDLTQSYMQLDEFKATDLGRRDGAVATMTATRKGDAFVGTWLSKTANKEFGIFLARRIY